MNLSEVLPTTAINTVSEFTCRNATGKLQVKDLPKVPTWRQKWDSNPQPSGREASTKNEPPRPTSWRIGQSIQMILIFNLILQFFFNLAVDISWIIASYKVFLVNHN